MGFRIIFLFIFSLITFPAQAAMDEALSEINETVHGITKTHIENGVLWLEIIDVGADYDFMALVTCRLLNKYNIQNITKVSVRDTQKLPDAATRVLGSYKCEKK